MRGGTSRGVFFKKQDLPADLVQQDAVIQAAFGSPDPYGRQINGLGGATSTTSKVAIISPRAGEPNTIDYTFGQVSIGNTLVDRKGNCGNISSAVGPYAVDEGMVEAHGDQAVVRIYNTNTKKYIISRFALENGKAAVKGGYEISGIPGTGAKVALDFERPGGSVTGKLLPSGHVTDILQTSFGPIEVSIVDAANPLVFFRARDLGLTGKELPTRVDSDPALLARIEEIRGASAILVGMAKDLADATRNSPAVPKIAWVAPGSDYVTTAGDTIKAGDFDFLARIMSMGKLHASFAVTGAVCLAGAASIPGTVVNEMLPADKAAGSEICFGHPGGTLSVAAKMESGASGPEYVVGTVFRTARRIMDGFVYVDEALGK
jgi:methylitaconate Delta-isomerase